MGGPGGTAELNARTNQDLVAANRDVGADPKLGPAELVLDTPIGLPDPVVEAVDLGDFGRDAAGWTLPASRERRAGAGW